ncbi:MULTISPECIES: helix-turn-helix domain-containing protein [Brevibacillus]|uniref:helix-turn-helix domain-containing protein n=1 Tax=Brevibacillus TaxID=55080 RepID=UPI000E2F9FDC|nr:MULTISPECIES: helix-turn-helix domain-containing protein [Brevibacillus]MCG7320268.1 helix-turn-helix domain-containing protein [Brevibacillus laterosporus]MED1788090.1 helix-turn-helix domain-containing protein [Brevibacillus laterosporus]RFB28426.1 helix-turn-helix domain-containing protein [Brevibacillus sp. VP]
MNEISVARKITEFRKRKGLTSKELAKLADITPSMLSQIEKGIANPSLQTLKLISAALNIPLFNFFLEDTNTEELVVRANQRKKISFPESGDVSYELLSPSLNGALELALMNLLPQTASSKEPIEHKGEEVAFVIEGVVNLYLNNEMLTLNKGDSVKIPSYGKHKWENVSSENVIVIFGVTPPSF